MKIAEFGALLAGMGAALHEAEAELVKGVAEHVAETAKGLLGHEQAEWPPLAESTLEDKRRHGYPVPSPLLRTGEHIRDTIEVSEPEREDGKMVAYVGTDSKIALYQELGTSKIPPRPFLALAVDRQRDRFQSMVLTMMKKGMGGRE